MKTAKSKESRWGAATNRQNWTVNCNHLSESIHLWTLSSRLRENVCRGRCENARSLEGSSLAGLSAPLARCCTAESAPARRLLAFDTGNEKLLSSLVALVLSLNSTPMKKLWVWLMSNTQPLFEFRAQSHIQLQTWALKETDHKTVRWFVCVTPCAAHTLPPTPYSTGVVCKSEPSNGQTGQNGLLSWRAFRVTNTKETVVPQFFLCALHDHVTWIHWIPMRRTKPKWETSLCLCVNNAGPQTSESLRMMLSR